MFTDLIDGGSVITRANILDVTVLLALICFMARTAAASLVGHWTRDGSVADAAVVDSAGSCGGAFSDPTDPGTSYHHRSGCEFDIGSSRFDGVNGYMPLPRASALETSSPLTASAWIQYSNEILMVRRLGLVVMRFRQSDSS